MPAKKKATPNKSPQATANYVKGVVHKKTRKNHCGHSVHMRISAKAIKKILSGKPNRAAALKRINAAIKQLDAERNGSGRVTILHRDIK